MTPKDATDEDMLFDAQCDYLKTLEDIDDSTENGEKLFIFKRGQAIERARMCEELRQRIDDQIAELQVKVEAAEMGGNNTPSEYSTIGTLSQVKGWLNEIEAA